jgi:hypothetical protein
MMDGADLYQELISLDRQLTASLKRLYQNGVKAAEAEAEYQTAKAAEALKLKDSGYAIGMIDLMIRGRPGVAEKRLKRDIEEVNYKVNLEHIQAVKLQMRMTEAAIEREFGMAGKE